ncbi:MAG: alanine racemase [Candidatus Thorarchaeota archaeon]
MDILEIPTPAILVDKHRLAENIRMMGEKTRKNKLSLRPHIKTHKCIEIGNLQKEEGIQGITVATLSEAITFMNNGFNNITYAVPLSSDKVGIAAEINNSVTLNVLVDNPFILERLSMKAGKTKKELNVLVKVDCGYHRVGVDPLSDDSIRLVEKILNLKWLNFQGILTHAGHSYSGTSIQEIRHIANQEQDTMIQFANRLQKKDIDVEAISIGSTPTIMLAESFHPDITEVRPGSYVYFDYMQVVLGSCEVTDCSFSLLSSIMSKRSDGLVIDAGATALSKDLGPRHIEPDCGFGKFYSDFESGTLDALSTITSLSQEHGKVKYEKESFLSSKTLDDKLRILPNHSCLTNNLFDEVYVVDGEKVIDRWKIHRGFSSA